MEYWILQILNGVSWGMLLFLIASGFTLTFGLMRVISVAHGSFYMLGGYLALSVVRSTGSFSLGAIGSVLAMGIVGMGIYRALLRHNLGELEQVFLTFGLLFLLGDIALWVWTGHPALITKPKAFDGVVRLWDSTYPLYRLFVIATGLIVAAFLWWFQERTRYGALIRAGVDDEEMSRAIGINIALLKTLVFGLGTALAALGGVLGGPLMGMYPGLDLEVLLLAMVVVVVGGVGSLLGAFVSSLIVGLADNLGKVVLPELSLFLVFAIMAIVLVVRPSGLFGKV
jgi:branched-chain amino acid transport system permease protein